MGLGLKDLAWPRVELVLAWRPNASLMGLSAVSGSALWSSRCGASTDHDLSREGRGLHEPQPEVCSLSKHLPTKRLGEAAQVSTPSPAKSAARPPAPVRRKHGLSNLALPELWASLCQAGINYFLPRTLDSQRMVTSPLS